MKFITPVPPPQSISLFFSFQIWHETKRFLGESDKKKVVGSVVVFGRG